MKYAIILCLGLVSCSRVTLEKYAEYRSANDFQYNIDTLANETTYRLTYVPIEEIVVSNVGSLSKEELKAEYHKMKLVNMSSFQLRMSSNILSKSSNKSQKTEQMEYYAVEFKKHIKAINNLGDTLDCSNYLLLQNGVMGGQLMFEFDFQNQINAIQEIVLNANDPKNTEVRIDLSAFHRKYPTLKI